METLRTQISNKYTLEQVRKILLYMILATLCIPLLVFVAHSGVLPTVAQSFIIKVFAAGGILSMITLVLFFALSFMFMNKARWLVDVVWSVCLSLAGAWGIETIISNIMLGTTETMGTGIAAVSIGYAFSFLFRGVGAWRVYNTHSAKR